MPTANVAEEIPVVDEPLVPAAKLAFANTCPRAVASLVNVTSEQITNVCIGLSYTKGFDGMISIRARTRPVVSENFLTSGRRNVFATPETHQRDPRFHLPPRQLCQ